MDEDVRPDPELAPPRFDTDLDASLRRLAQRIVQDAAAADDVVQETWLAALRERRVLRPSSWLRAVTRRLAGARRRREELQRVHETQASRPEAAEPVREFELQELQSSITRSLQNVHGRIGEVMRLRYAEGMKLREIAERLDVPLGTVKADHAQGLRHVRARLESDYGSERRSALALVPLAAESVATQALRSASVRRSVTATLPLLGVGVAVLALAALVVALRGDAARRAHEPRVVLAASVPAEREEDPAAPPSAGGTAAPGEAEVTAPEESAPAADPQVAGATPLDAAPQPNSKLEASAVPEVVRVELEVSALGEPTADVAVRAFGARMRLLQEQRTDADGRARFQLERSSLREPHVVGGNPTVVLSVLDPTRAAPYSLLLEVDDHDVRRAALAQDERALRVLGSVVDDVGVPIAGASVYVDPATFSPIPAGPHAWLLRRVERKLTDASGTFAVERLTPGAHVFVVQVKGFISNSWTVTFDTAGTRSLPAPLVIERGAALQGRLTDVDGRPLAAASVWLEVDDSETVRRWATTGPDGDFTLEGVPAGRQRVWAVARVGDGYRSGTAAVELDARAPARWDGVLASPGLGSLKIEDTAGLPVAACRVRVQTAAAVREFSELVAVDDEGRVELPRDPGEPVRIVVLPVARDSFAALMPLGSWVVDGPWTGDRVLVVPAHGTPRGSLAGIVADVDGAPLPSASLLLVAEDHRFAVRVPLDEAGRFVCEDVPAGDYSLQAFRAEAEGVAHELARLQLEEGQDRDLGELRVPPAAAPTQAEPSDSPAGSGRSDGASRSG